MKRTDKQTLKGIGKILEVCDDLTVELYSNHPSPALLEFRNALLTARERLDNLQRGT